MWSHAHRAGQAASVKPATRLWTSRFSALSLTFLLQKMGLLATGLTPQVATSVMRDGAGKRGCNLSSEMLVMNVTDTVSTGAAGRWASEGPVRVGART